MRVKKGIPVIQILLLVWLVLLACDVRISRAENSEPSKAKNFGFEAVITGAYEGEVSGKGVLQFLPQGGFRKQGYFFLADGRGIRPHGVTFVLPRGLATGKHRLESPSPLDIGTVPSVRVDRDLGDSVASSERNTTGFVELTAFPADESQLSGAVVAGRFQFATEDSNGKRIKVKGEFSFKAK